MRKQTNLKECKKSITLLACDKNKLNEVTHSCTQDAFVRLHYIGIRHSCFSNNTVLMNSMFIYI